MPGSGLLPHAADAFVRPEVSAPAATSLAPESIIGNDLSIEGQAITIRCQGVLRVNGNIQADLHSRRLVVGQEARIDGAITAETVTVSGEVRGSVHGTRVILKSGAVVEGDIHAELLTIEEGASFDGRSRRAKDAREVAPQLEPTLRREAPARAYPQSVAANGPATLGEAFLPGPARKVPG